MRYEGITSDDLVNVHALNTAWLGLAEDAGIRAMSQARRNRLAAVPFLLFTFRESDDGFWQQLVEHRPQLDLLKEAPDGTAEVRRLQNSGLAFMWDLARRNPYVARVISGAPLQWCDRISAVTIAELLERAAHHSLIGSRFANNSTMYGQLVSRGTSATTSARRFSQIAALQSLLMSGASRDDARLPAAACRMRPPARRIGDKV